jgi:hypothetical protein
VDLQDIFNTAFSYALRVLPLAIGIGFFCFMFWSRMQKQKAKIKRHKDAGTIGPAGLIQGSTLPMQYDRLASIGTMGEAARTLDDTILRPTIGVRLLALGLAAMVFCYFAFPEWQPEGLNEALREIPVPLFASQLFIFAAALNGVFYIFGHEARYNRDLLITTRMFLHRREFRWKDLDYIGDDGNYELVLKFRVGGKAKVLKHSRGVEEFKRFAMAQLQKNR